MNTQSAIIADAIQIVHTTRLTQHDTLCAIVVFCFLTAHLRVICDLCISMPIHICTSTNLQLPCIALTHIIQCSHYICDLIQLTLKHTCAGCAQTSRYVFTYRLVHGIVQITMHVTFRCTFHRAPNQHINRDTLNTRLHAGCHQHHTIMHIYLKQLSFAMNTQLNVCSIIRM